MYYLEVEWARRRRIRPLRKGLILVVLGRPEHACSRTAESSPLCVPAGQRPPTISRVVPQAMLHIEFLCVADRVSYVRSNGTHLAGLFLCIPSCGSLA